MNCLKCDIFVMCKYKDELYDTVSYWSKRGFQLDVVSCPRSMTGKMPDVIEDMPDPSEFSGVEVTPYNKNNIVVDYEARSNLIKNAYRDANSDMVRCPSCGSQVYELFKCVCGKAVCNCCGNTIVDVNTGDSNMLCDDCYADYTGHDDEITEENDERIQFSNDDINLIRDAVKKDIPTK